MKFSFKYIFAQLIILVFLVNGGLASDKIVHKYHVSVSRDLDKLFVKATFGSRSFFSLYAGSDEAALYTKNMKLVSDNQIQNYIPVTDEVPLKQSTANSELTYEVDIIPSKNSGRRKSVYKVATDIIIPPDVWFWRPEKLSGSESIEVEFDLPKGINISLPWQRTGKNKFRLNNTPYYWPSVAALGTFKIDTLQVPNAKLAVAILGDNSKINKDDILYWIKNAAQSVCNVYGQFPVSNAQILIIPGGPKKEAVPFALVVRGGGYSIQFFIDPSHPLSEFISDWTATHELSHSLLPFISRKQMWLSEGLATYYQYICMGRDGRLSEQETWQRIYNGFQKGIRNSKDKSVKYTAENMGRYHAYPFVYWTGAAMMFKADVILRKNSNGKKSLDEILKKLGENHFPEKRAWGGREMLEEMDHLANSNVFINIYKEHINDLDFPIDDNFFNRLGIVIKNNQVTLTDDAPLAHVRKQIMQNPG